ncbi:MAG TPA: carbohydrate kinase [Actinophytocola sp.]|uniref:carbohydrate kinase family protein n=1 Tax=Actinophytocola sp. TaxID=1872138 RepID=UPI002DB9CEB6|nr:carbohydrate kinase [Actinophytocola sp.]HEU5475427.1 carbohydrate kinase [Actinophytocola sp.]
MIVVGGEALIDLVPVSSTVDDGLAPLRPFPGGGPYNVAIAAGRLGAPVRFLSRLSTDAFGDALLRRLHRSGVDTGLVQRGPEPTTLAVAGIGPDGSARYTFHVEGTADRLVADPGELPPEVDTLSLGTLSLLLEPGASTYESLLRRHARRGGLTVLDPNIRPVLVSDPDGHRARFASWLPDVGLLKLSVEDARWLAALDSGTPEADVLAVVRSWLAEGPAAAVLTRGGAGLAVLTGDGGHLDVPAPRVTVVDTIGAGDTVHGALLCWLHRTGVTSPDALRAVPVDAWRAALGFAARAAAVTVSRAGAEPPYAAELDPA